MEERLFKKKKKTRALQEESHSKAEEPPKKSQNKDFFCVVSCGVRHWERCQEHMSLDISILFSVTWPHFRMKQSNESNITSCYTHPQMKSTSLPCKGLPYTRVLPSQTGLFFNQLCCVTPKQP